MKGSEPGMILATHSSREADDFVILKRITGHEYPPIKVDEEIRDILRIAGQKTPDSRGYIKVWYQKVEIPHE